MRVGIQAWGSDGDIRPLLALGSALVSAGHDVRMVASSADDTDYSALAARLRVPLTMVPERMNAPLGEIAARAGGGSNQFKLMREVLAAAFYPHLDAMYAAALELCRTSDVVVGHFAAWFVRVAAWKTGARLATFVPWPGMVPTGDEPPVWFPRIPGLTRAQWRLVTALAGVMCKKGANELLRREGLPPVRVAIPDLLLSDGLNLLAASPALWPRASDWDERHQVCGAFELPEDSEPWQLPPDLSAFLESGAPPVFLSFGSSEQVDPARSRELLVEGARRAGVRAVIQLKSERRAEGHRDGQLYFLPRAPHTRLFPRCSFVVHHGGAGTSHTVARAGVPSVAVYFSDEQRSWGDRLAKHGLAPPPLSYFRTDPDAVAARIRAGLGAPEMSARAAAMAARMRGENGPAAATNLLETWVEKAAE